MINKSDKATTLAVHSVPTAMTITAPSQSWIRSAGVLSLATVVISGGNYVFSLFAVQLLGPAEFSRFAAAQGLLLVLGTGAMAAVPWAVARYLALQQHPGAPREALHFGLTASLVQALVIGPVAGVVLWSVAGWEIGVVTAACAFFIGLTAVPVGFMQGTGQIEGIAAIRVAELLGRFVVGIGLVVLVSRTATSALLGFPAGSALLLGLGLLACRKGLPARRGSSATVRSLIRASAALGAVQVLLSMLAALDSVVAQGAGFASDVAGSYQAAGLLGRVPVFLGAAIGMASYTAMAQARTDAEVGVHLRGAMKLYTAVTVPVVVGAWTVPDPLLALVVPREYTSTAELLRFTVVSGAAVGLATVLVTAHQATARFRRALLILVPAAVLQPVLLILAGRTGSATTFAVVLAAMSLVTVATLGHDALRWDVLRAPRRWLGWPVIAVLLLATAFLHNPAVWAVDLSGATLMIFARAAGKWGGTDSASAAGACDAPSTQPDGEVVAP